MSSGQPSVRLWADTPTGVGCWSGENMRPPDRRRVFQTVLGPGMDCFGGYSKAFPLWNGGRLFNVLQSLCRVDDLPHYQSISREHSSSGVASPSRMDSRMPGVLERYSVSWIERQSSSETRTALPRLPVMTIGSCDVAVSSISLCSPDLASVAVMVGMGSPHCCIVLPVEQYVMAYVMSSGSERHFIRYDRRAFPGTVSNSPGLWTGGLLFYRSMQGNLCFSMFQ